MTMEMQNKYHVKHKRQSLSDFQKDIHRFSFWYNGKKEVACVSSLYIGFDHKDEIPDEAKKAVQKAVYSLMDKNENKWSIPKGAQKIADAYCAEEFESEG